MASRLRRPSVLAQLAASARRETARAWAEVTRGYRAWLVWAALVVFVQAMMAL